jgi:hypothetical protein
MQNPLGTIRAQPTGLPASAPSPAGLPRRYFSSPTARNNLSGVNPTSQTFGYTGSSISWTVPETTLKFESMVGKGQNGSPGNSTYVKQYDRHTTIYNTSLGGTVTTQDGGTVYGVAYTGALPSNYCGPETDAGGGARTQECYQFTDSSYWDVTPATNGVSMTAFGVYFPGGQGDVAPLVTVDTPTLPLLQPGAVHTFTVPVGCSLTITYYQ